jgi:uncharacterized DUF497 family protein
MFALKLPCLFSTIHAIPQLDYTFDHEERWITVGAVAIGRGLILWVVHAFHEEQNEEVIRIIPARAAEFHERRADEEAHKGAEARHEWRRNRQVLSANEEARDDASRFRRHRMAQSGRPRLSDQSQLASATCHDSCLKALTAITVHKELNSSA